MEPLIYITQDNYIKIHSFTYNHITTHIIENLNCQKLIVIDLQDDILSCQGFKQYIDSLNKEINYILLTKTVPDYYSLITILVLEPCFIGALKSTILDIIDLPNQESNLIPIPNIIINCTKYTFNQIELDIDQVENIMVIKLPQINSIILQNLLYNCVHLQFKTINIKLWIDYLKNLNSYNVYFVRHGIPSNKSEIVQDNIYYLQIVNSMLAKNTPLNKLFDELTSSFKEYQGIELLEL